MVEVFAPNPPKAGFAAGVVELVSEGLLPNPKPVVVVVPVVAGVPDKGVDDPPNADGVEDVLAPNVPNVFCGTGVVLPEPALATINHTFFGKKGEYLQKEKNRRQHH